MKIFRIMTTAFTAITVSIMLTACGEVTESITYNNPYAGDWYELEDNGNGTWDAVKLSLSDSTFEISDTTFNADGENPDGYSGVSRGDVKELSDYEIFIKTTERNINDEWFSRDEYIDDLVENYAFTELEAETKANLVFTSSTVNYTIGSSPTRLILGSGTGTDTDYMNMTYYTSVFSAKSGLSGLSGF